MTPDPKPAGGSPQEEAQEQALRRLLAEAVEPVQPGPGAETRLRARIRAKQEERLRVRRRRHRMLGWGATALGSAAVVLVAVVLLVNGGGRSSSSGSSSAGSAASPLSTPAGPTAAGQEAGAGTQAAGPEVAQLSTPYAAAGRVTPLQFTATPTPTLSLPDVPGAPSVQLPPTGRGAGIRAITHLPMLGGGTVDVAVVRLQADPNAVDVLVSLAGDGLTLLQLDGRLIELRVDATHGYACTPNGLALAGQRAPYVVDGNELVKSPDLVAVAALPQQASC